MPTSKHRDQGNSASGKGRHAGGRPEDDYASIWTSRRFAEHKLNEVRGRLESGPKNAWRALPANPQNCIESTNYEETGGADGT